MLWKILAQSRFRERGTGTTNAVEILGASTYWLWMGIRIYFYSMINHTTQNSTKRGSTSEEDNPILDKIATKTLILS